MMRSPSDPLIRRSGRIGAALVFLLTLAGCAGFPQSPASYSPAVSLAAEGVRPEDAGLIVYRLEDGRMWISGEERIDERFVPASTSKIAHTLLAIETGAVSGPDEVFRWDGEVRSIESWNQDQVLAEAFSRSAVWVYQQIVPRIGQARLREGLSAFGYGNADIGEEDDLGRYWLDGPLAISAREQVGFLARLARRTLPLSARTYAAALPIMIVARGDGWILYGKTGMASRPDEPALGWFVGWLEQTGGPAPGTYVFALNMDMPGGMRDAARRRAGVERVLQDIGALSR